MGLITKMMSNTRHLQKIYFITGASRSGTTLLSFVLRNHSSIAGLKELQFFGEFWDPREPDQALSDSQLIDAAASVLARQAQGILSSRPTEQDMEQARMLVADLGDAESRPAELFARLAAKLAAAEGKPVPSEQTPRNIFYADALLRLYPEAHVVHMMRDPRAVMASQKKRWQRRQLATDKSRFPLRQSIRVWVNYHPYTVAKLWSRATREASKLKSHPRFTLIRFEDLLEAPEQTVRYLCGRLGVEFEPAMLEVGQINSSHQSSVGGARKGLNKSAIDTWKQTLSTTEIAIVQRMCERGMAENAYFPISVKQHPLGSLWLGITYLFHGAGVLLLNPKRAWIQLRAAMSPKDAGSGGNRPPGDVARGEQR